MNNLTEQYPKHVTETNIPLWEVSRSPLLLAVKLLILRVPPSLSVSAYLKKHIPGMQSCDVYAWVLGESFHIWSR